jgi:prenyl protein peptidase
VQLGYTSVFGLLSTYMFTRTGNIVGPILSHCFCNYIGFPRFDAAVGNYKLITLYVLGVVLFFALLAPLTNPTLHESVFFSEEFLNTSSL